MILGSLAYNYRGHKQAVTFAPRLPERMLLAELVFLGLLAPTPCWIRRDLSSEKDILRPGGGRDPANVASSWILRRMALGWESFLV